MSEIFWNNGEKYLSAAGMPGLLKVSDLEKEFMKTEAWICEGCGYKLDAVSDLEGRDRQPRIGDITMCINCGKLYNRCGDDKWRAMTAEAFNKLSKETRKELHRIAYSHRVVINRRNRSN